MMNRNFTLVLLVSFLVLPFSFIMVNSENISAYDMEIEINDLHPMDTFTKNFKGTYEAKAFVGPDNSFAVVNASIYAATTSVYLEVYTLSSQNLVDALLDAHGRGVTVIVLLEPDHVSGYEDDYTNQSAYLLDQAGIEVLMTTSGYDFTHAKFWVVDSQYSYVYTGNWAPSSLPADTDARTNREMGLMFNDVDIATFYEDIFFEDYYKASAYNNVGNPGHTLPSESSGTYVPVKPSPLSLTEYMEVIPVFSPNNSYEMLSSLIANATTTIDVQQQYFSFTCDLVDDLIDAAKKGISIRVMVPEPTSATNNVTETLLSNGIDIRWSKSLYNHNKFILVDGEIVSVTSINWSNGSVDDNRESGAIVKNTNIATYLGDVFENDWENLTEIPVGFLPVVEIISPEPNVVVENTIQVEVGLYLATYTTAELYLNDSLIHTWTSPSSTATYSLDTTLYNDGMKTLKLKATTNTAQILEEEIVFNIINTEDWLLLITEVRWDATTEPEGEFFELYNGFAFDVAIGTWEVSDGEATYIIPDGTTFESEDILIFVRDETTYTTEMTSLGVTFYTPDFIYTDILLANTGDELMLSEPGGEVVDEVAWGTSASTTVTPWTGDMDDTMSLQRDPANYDTDDCSVDFIAGSPNPGTVYIKTSKTFPGFALFSVLSAIIITTVTTAKRRRK
ncbi:MAG: hypothetical protein EAX90_05905 [Candidatus Heimdallarchaeota archaeon]|nr:hypothetical protein [Candidatus Heimdallarchaeota archaeon]